jgi:hypothetical protein
MAFAGVFPAANPASKQPPGLTGGKSEKNHIFLTYIGTNR